VFPWPPCSSVYISDTYAYALAASTPKAWRAQVYHEAPAHTRPRSLEPCTLAGPLSCCVSLSLRPRCPRNPCASNRFVHRTIDTVYMRASPAAHSPPSRAVHVSRGGHAQRITFPFLVHPRQCACLGRLRVHFACTRRLCSKQNRWLLPVCSTSAVPCVSV
jgi:hypothetical protein